MKRVPGFLLNRAFPGVDCFVNEVVKRLDFDVDELPFFFDLFLDRPAVMDDPLMFFFCLHGRVDAFMVIGIETRKDTGKRARDFIDKRL